MPRDNYVEANCCDPATPEKPTLGSGAHTATGYSDCASGYPVQWVAFDGDHISDPFRCGLFRLVYRWSHLGIFLLILNRPQIRHRAVLGVGVFKLVAGKRDRALLGA